MKIYCILVQSGPQCHLKSFLDVQTAQNYAASEARKKQVVPHLLETIRNDICDRGAFMVGNFLDVASNETWSVSITVQNIEQ